MAEHPGGHEVRLMQGAQAFFAALISDIASAAHEVRLETYIFSVQGGGEQVAQALLQAAQRGVNVYLVVDGVGTPGLPDPWPARFNAAGLHWLVYKPWGRLGWILPSAWRRLHRKLCLVDDRVAYCGGINVLDDWWDPNYGPLASPRFDFAVRVRGPLVRSVHRTMVQLWWRARAAQRARHVDWLGVWQALQQEVRDKRRDAVAGAAPGAVRAQLVLRDNLRHRSRIERAYRAALAQAQQDILLANAYFLPSRRIYQGLIDAARRGVRVRLLLQGRYEYFMSHHGTRALYAGLLAAGVEIFEYHSSFLHAKVALVDDHWATVGSSNIDPLSLLLAREANVVIEDVAFARQLRERLEQAMAEHALKLDAQRHAGRSLLHKALDASALFLMRTLLILSGKRY